MIDNMTRPMRRMAQKAANSTKGMRGLANSARDATGGLNRMGRMAGQTAGSLRKMGNDASFADRRLHRLARRMRNMQTIRLGMGGALTSLGTGLVTRQVGSTLIDYEKAMNMVKANIFSHIDKTTGNLVFKGFENAKNPILESAEAMKALRKETQRISQVSIFDPTQVAEGLLELARAGFSAQEQLTALHPVMRLASAGALAPKQALDIATNINTAFGKDIEHTAKTADILAMAASNANTTVSQLGQAMKYAAPSAVTAGRSMEETTAVLMSLAKRGLKDSIGGTSVARMLESVYKRSGPAVKALKSIGLAHKDFMGAEGQTLPIADMLEKFQVASKKFGKEKVIMAIQAMMGSRGGRAAKLLYEAADEIRANEKLLQLAKDRAKLMEKIMMSGVYGAYEKMRSSLYEAVIALGDGGLSSDIEYLADKVRSLANSFSELSPSTQKWVGRALLLATAISAIIIPLGIFAWALGALIPMFALLLSPIGLVVAGLAALATWLMHKYDISFDDMIQGAKAFGHALMHPLETLQKIASFSWGKIREGVRSLFPESWLTPDEDPALKTAKKIAGAASEKAETTVRPVLTSAPSGFYDSPVYKLFQRMTEAIRDPNIATPKSVVSGKSLAKSEVDKQTALNVRTETKVDVSAPPSVTLKGIDGRVHGSIPLTTSSDKGRTQVDSAAIATP